MSAGSQDASDIKLKGKNAILTEETEEILEDFQESRPHHLRTVSLQEIEIDVEPTAKTEDDPSLLTEYVLAELHKVFDLHANRNGIATRRQLMEMMKVLGFHPRKDQFQRVFALCGVPQTAERCSFETFKEIMQRLIYETKVAGGIAHAFTLYDVKREGKITFESLRKVVDLVGETFTDEELREMIAVADADRDGFVNMVDFAKLMKLTDLTW